MVKQSGFAGGVVAEQFPELEYGTDYDFFAFPGAQGMQGGADWLHVVDLAASRDGSNADLRPLLRLLAGAEQNVQTGGGVRDTADIQKRLDHGASRVVIGSLSEAAAGSIDAGCKTRAP